MSDEPRVNCLKEKFAEIFGEEPAVYRAPGRVNLIGEHTDYNDGFVMPAAIDRYIWAAIRPRADRKIRIHSANYAETREFDLDQTDPKPDHSWLDYPRGVAVMLQAAGLKIGGSDILVRSDVPIGAGLSSSAAFEVSVAYALLAETSTPIDRTQLAKICQRAENEFVGIRSGLMDQFTVCHGVADRAIVLDCRSLEYELVKLPEDLALVICNTMVKHELGSSEYNSRRADCEEGVRLLSRRSSGLEALRDVSLADLDEHRSELPEKVYWHCRHVVTENERVQKAVAALKANDTKTFGDLMYESHRSLRDDYEVSSPELNLMVEIAGLQRGVVGARMTGGGFGGCTVNLVAEDTAETFVRSVAVEYESRTGIKPEIYVCTAVDGVKQADGADKVAKEGSA
jgi:galactokinase